MNTAWATALDILDSRPGAVTVLCRLDDGAEAPAIAYPHITGPVAPGDRLLLNTTALDKALGTGGAHFVIADLSAPPRHDDSPGHIIKMRYTPLQVPVLAVEEPASSGHAALREADTLDGMPVVCCELLSQVPAVLAGLRSEAERPRTVALVVTDEAALPVAYSRLIADLRARGLVACVLSAGQAFGGDLEAVSVFSALLAARHVAGADVALVSPGPGTVGTGTRWGFGGVAQGEALNAACALGGRGIGAVRASAADPRNRHRGISHHTRTVFTRVALGSFAAGWPAGYAGYDPDWEDLCRGTMGRMKPFRMNGCAAALDAFSGIGPAWTSMGRTRADDPLFFEAACAAGLLAQQFLEGTE